MPVKGFYKKPNRYRNTPTMQDGIRFDSKREAERYSGLKMLEKAGKIHSLELQPRFVICEAVEYQGEKMRAREYWADFAYFEVGNPRKVVEDVKSPATAKDRKYRLKRQLFLARYGKDIDFKEVR